MARNISKRSKAHPGEVSQNRKLVLVDIENFAGKGSISVEDVEAARDDIVERIDICRHDKVIIGVSGSDNWRSVRLGWKHERMVFRTGHNGADKALVEVTSEYDADDFDNVYIISGDGFFMGLANRYSERGLGVIVIGREGGIHSGYYGTDCQVIAV